MLEDMSSADELPRLSQESFSEYFNSSQKSNDYYNDLKEIIKDVADPDVSTCSGQTDNLITVDYVSSVGETCNLTDNFPGIEPLERIDETYDQNVISPVIKTEPLTFPPPLINWTGYFGFDIFFEPPVSSKKVTWIYSATRDKLYVTKDKPCCINFITHGPVPEGTKIRALGLFSMSKHSTDVVCRCTNHLLEDMNAGVPNPEHLIHCESDQAIYEKDEESGIQSVVVPYEMPQRGQHYSTYIYKFVCFGSCPGMNRRPIKIVFSLEWENSVIGQHCVEVKICASPCRDSRNDDKQDLVSNAQLEKRHIEEGGSVQTKIQKTEARNQVNHGGTIACTSVSTVTTMISETTTITHASTYPPAIGNWEGQYKFSLQIHHSDTAIYSEVRNKLYAVKDYPCNITFKTEYSVPGDTNIRITPVYALPEHANLIVYPCGYNKALGIDKDHIIRSLTGATYDINPLTSCRSVIVPFNRNISSCTSVKHCFSFRCYGPCKNCRERIPVKFIFTLENRNLVLGQCSCDVKLCEFPLRDCKNDDSTPKELERRNQIVTNPSNIFQTFDVMNTSGLDEDQRKPYVITVNNRKLYNYMIAVKQMLEMTSSTPCLSGANSKETASSNDET